MTGPFRVDLQQLVDIMNQIDRFDRGLEDSLEDIDARVAKLHRTWAGDAATAHQKAHDEWQRGVADMRSALAVMRQNTQVAYGNYRNAATTNAGMWEEAR